MYNNSYYGNFRNRKFSDIWERATNFVEEYKASGVYSSNNKISDTSAATLFYLLYSEYGNSGIASSDEEQFKYQVFTTIFEYGPTWEKRLDIQNKLRALTDEDLEQGTKTIYNKALNPGNVPSTSELSYINEQTTSNLKLGKLDKYTQLYEILRTDVTREFIAKFKKYFLQIVIPEKALWYVSEGEEDDN